MILIISPSQSQAAAFTPAPQNIIKTVVYNNSIRLIFHPCNLLLINSKKKQKETLDIAKYKDVKKTIKDYQKFIKENFKYVGENFAYEARSVHYDKKKNTKGIYGNASKKDLKELKEEGIEAQMIPWIEDKDN